MGNCNFLRQVKWRENYYRVKVPVEPRWGGGGGTPDFKSREWSNDRIQTKLKNFPGPKANPQKMPWRISKPSKFPESRRGYNTQQKKVAKTCGYYHDTTNPQIVLNIQKNPYLNQATQNKIPESKISKLSPKSFNHPRHLNSGVSPPHTHTYWGLNKTCLRDILLRKTHMPNNYTGKWLLKMFYSPFRSFEQLLTSIWVLRSWPLFKFQKC